ncbi:TPA_asm: hypothetical protein G0B48_07985 [Salmonella enterica subsp. indica]|uniref:Uncharacterized protein n=2 Tax=Salmonella enterica TaxID=28901 RepID=A0A702E1S0_SALER|nr:hypothetical protein [Salmonella enterica subsp. indica serovar 11:b:e,n,x]ESE86381.1 hypothetical protein SEI61121_06421 [Salmonella enterica subsp. indica serovar 6,14,25:z10:1,(2),7 str. 1121]HAC6565150.1 hypothetical protein [Salmonella enterica subsp. indica]HAC6574636.1 hypothetical protein [Salmonella enterica subsp. indica]
MFGVITYIINDTRSGAFENKCNFLVFMMIKYGENSISLVMLLIFMIIYLILITGEPKGFQSSNLCASARLKRG